MSDTGTIGKYSGLQILLHWLVALLVLGQYLSDDAFFRLHTAAAEGRPFDPQDLLVQDIHIIAGFAILILMALRFLLRWRDGTLLPPRGSSRLESLVHLFHLGFYAAIIGQSVVGILAAYVSEAAGALHGLIGNVIIGLLIAHLLGAVAHAVFQDHRVIQRMFVPRRR